MISNVTPLFFITAATFVELPVTKEVPASTELTVTHTICENKNDGCSFKDNTYFFELSLPVVIPVF